jgi:hypothetical protein
LQLVREALGHQAVRKSEQMEQRQPLPDLDFQLYRRLVEALETAQQTAVRVQMEMPVDLVEVDADSTIQPLVLVERERLGKGLKAQIYLLDQLKGAAAVEQERLQLTIPVMVELDRLLTQLGAQQLARATM